MRRLLVPLLVLMTCLVLATGAWADSRRAAQPEEPLVVAEPPSDWIGTEIVVTDLPEAPQAPSAAPASDSCSTATPLQLSFSIPADGSGTVTNGFTQEPTDPVLSCQYGTAAITPPNARGYRTAWHVLVAGDTSTVTVTTEGTEYDTVLGIYSGTCSAPVVIACSDDAGGFQSRATFQVTRGRTYYIEVADYQPGAAGTTTALLSAVMHPGGDQWNQITTMPSGGVSRHVLAREGIDMYIAGGQTNLNGIPTLSNRLLRYNTELKLWKELSPMPGPGISNTTAVRLQRRIFIPGGFNGNTTTYDRTHWVYDIPLEYWGKLPSIPTNLLPNGAAFAWAAAAAAPNEASYYLTGGITSYPALDVNTVVISNTYRFTPANNEWQAFQPLTTARYAHTAAWITRANRGLCVAGGLSKGTDGSGNPAIVLLTRGECNNGSGWLATELMNFPRYNAGSAVGPDGKWYVFGGVDSVGGVPETEVYDPVSNTWQVLSGAYSLGGRPESPARDWPRGDFLGDRLYIFGGNTPAERRVISAVEQMKLSTRGAFNLLLPFTLNVGSENFLRRASPLRINVQETGNFVASDQFFNPYYFDWPKFGRVTIRLGNIPSDTNYNIGIYDARKEFRDEGDPALTGDKSVSLTLAPGRYFVVVERIFPRDLPNPDTRYTLLVREG